MITCPSCNHQNPEGSLQCENCYTPLPATTSCPNCGASVQADATFCGQCGFNLQAENPLTETSIKEAVEETAVGSFPDISVEELSTTGAIPEMPLTEVESDILPETAMTSPISSPWDDDEEDLTMGQPRVTSEPEPEPEPEPELEPEPEVELEPTEMMSSPFSPDLNIEEDTTGIDPNTVGTMPWGAESPDLDLETDEAETEPAVEIEPENLVAPPEPFVEQEDEETSTSNLEPLPQPVPARTESNLVGATQLQLQTATLLHLQTNTTIEIANNLDVVHIGKPNGQVPPDIDVAGFPDSEIVSRLHADIRIEGDAYYLEDVGSSNGTYINHSPLVKGNRHRLRPGDRIALGKGDLVTFIFQIN